MQHWRSFSVRIDMYKVLFFGFVCIGLVEGVDAQLKRFYSLHDVDSYDTVDFSLDATSGISFVRTVQGGNPLNIFGNPDLDKINPSFMSQVKNNTCKVELKLDEFKSSGLGNGLVFAMFGDTEEEESNYWKMLLNDNKIYHLDLTFGIGSSDVDLSGAAVRNLRIKTGSADVKIGYEKARYNLTDMDTFMIKVDLGSIEAADLNLARARNIIADVGFGNAALDFGDKSTQTCDVRASVGAGNLTVNIPREAPIIIRIKDSPLCGISIEDNFEQVERNVYVSPYYDARADNLLKFDIDVSLGNIDFVYVD